MENPDYNFLQGGGEMGELIRSVDWSKTPLGPADSWPQALRIAVSIMLSTPFPMYIAWGREFIQLYNNGYRPILGSTKHPQAMGIGTSETFPEIWDIVGPMFTQVMNGEAIWAPDFMYVLDRNGYLEECYFDFSYSPIYNGDGTIGGVLVTVIETTENKKNLKKLEESNLALQNSQNNLNNLVAYAPVAMAVFRGPDYIVEIANAKALELWNKRADELMNKPLFEGMPEIKDQGIDMLLANVFTTGERFIANELPVKLLRDGELKTTYINFVYEALKDSMNNIYGVATVGVEVTEQVIARRQVEEAEERARLTVEAADIGTFDYSIPDDHIITSPRLDAIMGIKTPGDHNKYLNSVHPEDMAIRNKAYEEGYKTGKVFYEVRVLKGGETRWVQTKGQVYYNEKSEPVRILGTMLDITDQKNMEKRKDDFISIASHELKTPVTALKASLQMLYKLKDNPSDKFPRLIDQSIRSMHKVSTLIEDLLNVNRIKEAELPLSKSTFIISELLNASCNHISLSGKHELIILGDKTLKVYADERAIDQVVVNLVNNAVKYAPGSKNIYLKIEQQIDGKAKISVKDNGPGIPPNKLPFLFNRYYQVNSAGYTSSGLGLGLYISAEIVKRHGGEVGVESELGKGSTFWFTLPLE
jgi:two-component system sensor histidine kinase VicK